MSYIIHYFEDPFYENKINRFAQKGVHPTVDCFFYILVLCLPTCSNNQWLLVPVEVYHFSYLLSCFATIHHWHVAVHEYYIKTTFIFGHYFLFDDVKSNLSINSSCDNLLNILNAKHFQNICNCHLIIRLIIYN